MSYDLEGAIFRPSAAEHQQSGSTLNLTGGFINFDTTTGTYDIGAGAMTPSSPAVIYASESGEDYAVFSFGDIFLSTTTAITVSGNNSFALLSENNLTLNSTLSFNPHIS